MLLSVFMTITSVGWLHAQGGTNEGYTKEGNDYKVTTAKGLQAVFAELNKANTKQTTTITLDNDLDISELNVMGGNAPEGEFQGMFFGNGTLTTNVTLTIDGNGKRISGTNIIQGTENSNKHAAIENYQDKTYVFYLHGNGGAKITFKNLTIGGTNIVGFNLYDMKNVAFEDVTVSDNEAGGIHLNSTIASATGLKTSGNGNFAIKLSRETTNMPKLTLVSGTISEENVPQIAFFDRHAYLEAWPKSPQSSIEDISNAVVTPTGESWYRSLQYAKMHTTNNSWLAYVWTKGNESVSVSTAGQLDSTFSVGFATVTKVMLEAKAYTLTSALSIGRPVTITGAEGSILTTTNVDANLVTILSTKDVTLNNLTIKGSKKSGLHVYKSTNVTLDKVALTDNANAGLIVNGSAVNAKTLSTSNNGWGGVNIDKGKDVTETLSFTFDPTSSFTENKAQIWGEKENITTDVIANLPTGWRVIEGKGGDNNAVDMYYWTNKALTTEYYETYPNKSWEGGYTFIYANGNPITIQKGTDDKTVKITVDGTDEEMTFTEADKKLVVFGGAKNETVESSKITMLSGKVMNIFGGGYGEIATKKNAVVKGTTTIIAKGGEAHNIFGGGLYYFTSNSVDITISDITMDAGAWVFCGGQESGVTAGKNYPTFEEAANTLQKGKLTITGGTFGYIAIGGTDGAKGYTQDVEASISGATILGGVFGNGSNGGSDKVVGTVTNCKFTGTNMEIAAVNRGIAKNVSLTFKDCTFPASIYANLGATYKWAKNYGGSDSKIDGVPGSVAFTFINCGANTPVVGISDGLATANVTLTGAKAKIAKFTYDENKTTDKFTIGEGKTWKFDDGFETVASGDAATLSNLGTLVIPASDIMTTGIAAGGALQVDTTSTAVIEAMNAATTKEDLSNKNITIACKDGVIATNKETAKELLKAGKNALTLAYENSVYSTKVYMQQLAAITNLPATLVYGAKPVELAFNMEGVTATVKEGSTDVVKIETVDGKTTLTVLKPGTVTIDLTVTDNAEASSTQDLTVKPRTIKLTKGITATGKNYDGNTTISVAASALEFEGTVSEQTDLSFKNLNRKLADANAGDKQVIVTAELAGTSKDYYELAPITFVTAKVDPKAITIAAQAVSRNYGEEKAFSVTDYASSLVSGDVLDGSLKFDCAATATSPEGTYDIIPYGLSNPNYAITYTKGTLTVKAVKPTVKMVSTKVAVNGQQRDITVTAQITDLGGAKNAEAVTEAVTITGYPNIGELTATKNTDGTYSAIATVQASEQTYNFTAIATVTGSAALTSDASAPITVAIDGLTPQNIAFAPSVLPTLTYGQTMQLSATGSPIADAAYTYQITDGSDYASLSDGVLTAKKVGTVTIVAKQAGNETISAATATKTIEITPKPITVEVGAITKTYDGTTAITALPSFTLKGIESGAKVSVKAPKITDFAFANKNVGTSLVSCPTLTLDSLDADNYALIQPAKEDVKGTITKAPLTVKVDDVNRMWNDRYTKYSFSVVKGELFKGETLTSVYSGTFDVKENGETLELTVNPALCPNYALEAQNGKLTVSLGTPAAVVYGSGSNLNAMLVDAAGYAEKDLTVTVADGSAVITDNKGNSIGRSVNKITITDPSTTSSAAKSRLVTKAASNLIWDSEDSNLKTFGNATFEAKHNTATAYLSSNTDILLVDKDGMVTITGTGDAAIVAMKGSAEAHVIKYKVDAQKLEVTVANMDKTYDGTTQASGTIALDEKMKDVDVALDISGVSFNYASKDAAEGIKVNPSQAIILTGSEANNYDLQVALSGKIEKKDLNITSVSKYYDGLPTATLTDYATTDLVNGDIVPATVTFNDANVGAALKSVTVNHKNYELKSSVATNSGGTVTTGSILKSNIIATLPTEGSSVSNVKNNITLKVKETGADITNASAVATIKNAIQVKANGNNAFFISADANDNFTILFDGNQQIGKSSSVPPVVNPSVDVTGITLDVTAKTLAVGESFTLVATVTPTNADDTSVSWSSSDPTIASVDAEGKVTALKAGKATITATSNDNPNFTATCKVSVEAPTGIEEALADSRVYAKEGYIYIEPMAEMQAVVASMSGKVIYNNRISGQKQIPATPGVYVVKLISANKSISIKVGIF